MVLFYTISFWVICGEDRGTANSNTFVVMCVIIYVLYHFNQVFFYFKGQIIVHIYLISVLFQYIFSILNNDIFKVISVPVISNIFYLFVLKTFKPSLSCCFVIGNKVLLMIITLLWHKESYLTLFVLNNMPFSFLYVPILLYFPVSSNTILCSASMKYFIYLPCLTTCGPCLCVWLY
jgi:hypothetical protein